MICAKRDLEGYITDSPKTPSFSAGNDLGEEGLYYFNARWYDPGLGRFITEDPIKDGLNWYAYVNNNPINAIDPTGLSTINLGVNFTATNPIVFFKNAANIVISTFNLDVEKFDTSDQIEQGTVSAGVYIDSNGMGVYANYGSGGGTPELASTGVETGLSIKNADEYLNGESIEVGMGGGVPLPQTAGIVSIGGNASLVFTPEGELIGGEVTVGASAGISPVDVHIDYEKAGYIELFSFGNQSDDCEGKETD